MSKIPEGATHRTSAGHYRKIILGKWYGYCDGYWEEITGVSNPSYFPIQAEPEWTGEGLPPSGTACEMRRADYVNVGWQKIEFLFAGSKKAFFRDEQGHEWSRPLSDVKFRPVRTTEQIAAEKRDAAIKMIEARVNVVRLVAERIYDAGLRFEGMEK